MQEEENEENIRTTIALPTQMFANPGSMYASSNTLQNTVHNIHLGLINLEMHA
jgi:hypothetical protein